MLIVNICRFVLNKLLSVRLYGSLLTKCFTLNKYVGQIIVSRPKKSNSDTNISVHPAPTTVARWEQHSMLAPVNSEQNYVLSRIKPYT
jgi:hypothetical protein